MCCGRASKKLVAATWLTEEMAAYDDPQLYEVRDPREQFTRIKGTGRASRRELAILRELTGLARRGSSALRSAAQSRTDGRSPRATSPGASPNRGRN